MYNIKLISKLCDKYPQKLLNISGSPDIFFAIGNLSLLNTFSFAVVGSRNATLDAKVLTEKLVKDLVNQNITIISGMARGIDTTAHKACIRAGGNTIAILGCGFLMVEHQKIFKEILDNNGLIISEYFPDVPAFKFNFPHRNRIIAGMSDGVIITQAHENSGTLITAKHAMDLQKPIFTFPWNIDNENYRGNNLLLTQGAKCILSYKDILNNYPDFVINTKHTTSIKNIPENYSKIYNALSSTPIQINQLSQKTNIKISELQYKLTLMELEGYVAKMPNNSWTTLGTE